MNKQTISGWIFVNLTKSESREIEFWVESILSEQKLKLMSSVEFKCISSFQLINPRGYETLKHIWKWPFPNLGSKINCLHLGDSLRTWHLPNLYFWFVMSFNYLRVEILKTHGCRQCVPNSIQIWTQGGGLQNTNHQSFKRWK